jgi:hypothetical protein
MNTNVPKTRVFTSARIIPHPPSDLGIEIKGGAGSVNLQAAAQDVVDMLAGSLNMSAGKELARLEFTVTIPRDEVKKLWEQAAVMVETSPERKRVKRRAGTGALYTPMSERSDG